MVEGLQVTLTPVTVAGMGAVAVTTAEADAVPFLFVALTV
jgi:hypothetical protein